MSKYRCIPCDHEFELKNDGKPRCPKCLGIHDIEAVSSGKDAPVSSSKKVVPLALGILLVIGIVVYFAMRKDGESDEKSASALQDKGDLPSLLEECGMARSEAVIPFAASKEVSDFAQSLGKGQSGAKAMDALFDGMMELRSTGKWKPFHQREPRGELPLSALELVKKLQVDSSEAENEPYQATSYELATLLLAAARALDVDCQLVEILKFKGEEKPADESGKFGRYGVSLGTGTESEPPPIFDPYGGRSRTAANAEFRPLRDEEAMAPYYASKALSLLAERNTSEAVRNNDVAVRLDPQNPYFRMGRGLIFAASGAPNEALVEFEKALKQRSDPVTRTNLAEVLLLVPSQSSVVRAETEIQAVLAEVPGFGRAHGIFAMILLMKQEKEKAEQELALAERLDPDSPAIALYWAQFYAAQGLGEDAIEKAQKAVRLSEESLSSLIALAGIYRGTARFDEMRVTLDKVLERTPSPTMAEEIKQVFGYEKMPVASDETATQEKGASAGLGGVDESIGDLELKLGGGADNMGGAGMAEPGGGGRLKLGEGLGSGLGSQKGPSLGGEGLKLDLDMNK